MSLAQLDFSSHDMGVFRRVVVYPFIACLVIATATACDNNTSSETNPAANPGAASNAETAVNTTADIDPCKLVTKKMLSETFGVPAAKIEKSNIFMSCEYEWQGSNKQLTAVATVANSFDSEEQAKAMFQNATRSMSKEEVGEAMNKIMEQSENDAATEKKMLQGMMKMTPSEGIQFETVDDVGDAARFKTDTGDLHVRVDNKILVFSAYYGPSMPMPDDMSTIMQAVKTWTKETMPERKKAAIKLAKAAVDSM